MNIIRSYARQGFCICLDDIEHPRLMGVQGRQQEYSLGSSKIKSSDKNIYSRFFSSTRVTEGARVTCTYVLLIGNTDAPNNSQFIL